MTIDQAVDAIIEADNNIVVLKGILQELMETGGKEIVVKDSGLQAWLKEGFLKLNDDHFSNYPKEALAIKQLIRKASNVPNLDVKIVLYNMIEAFRWKKITGKTDYWRGVPLLPSMLNYRWDQVYESWKLAGVDSEVDEFIRGEA